jgi:DNA repair protein RecN (Recombination protein N)
MLVELRIRDYAVVEDLTLELSDGLNALTGETGAGKSIIVGALSLLLGERASSGVVRKGADRATVEAVFDISDRPEIEAQLEESGFRPEDGLMILRREVAAEGRNRAWVNGSPVTAGVVGSLGSALVDLHGQHEHQTLLRPRDQRALLDAYIGAEDSAAKVAALYSTRQALKRELEDREERLREIETRSDFLQFQLDEIDEAALRPGDDAELESEAGRHEHAEELARGAGSIYETLYAADDSVADRIAAMLKLLERLASFDPGLQAQVSELQDAAHAVSDVGRHVGDYAQSIDHDPGRLAEVRARLDLIFRLKRKYGPELADVLAAAQAVRTELAELGDSDRDLELLRRRIESTGRELEQEAARLSALRQKGSTRLAALVCETLPELGLVSATFEVSLRAHGETGSGGAESVEFLVSTNVGFDAMPLARIASGGELSRVMLALKSILAEVDRVPVLVFDEIDAGIGGVVASAVAKKLADIANRHQVFVVTHLAQVASRANGHFLVEKSQDLLGTTATVTLLEGEARVQEIARMLGGDPESATSREHARELLGI